MIIQDNSYDVYCSFKVNSLSPCASGYSSLCKHSKLLCFLFTGRTKIGQSAGIVAAVDAIVTGRPRKSIRSTLQVHGIGHKSVRRTLKKNLVFKPYKIPVVQILKEEDSYSCGLCDHFG